jgi:hypothetical protein
MIDRMKKYLDFGSIVVIILTAVLFAISLFVKGLTHDLLLEAGVLLVSIKLIIMAYKTNIYYSTILDELKELGELIIKNKKAEGS